MGEAVGYAIRMFPQTSETFIVNEILELERRGIPVRVFSYLRPKEAVPHESVRRIRGRVTYLPDPLYREPARLARAHGAMRRLEPARYRATLRYVASRGRGGRGWEGTGLAWYRFLQAGCLAILAKESGVRHLHAHFAHEATEVAMLASMLTGLPFSFTAHARDIFSHDVDEELLREKVARAHAVVTVSRFNRDFLMRKVGASANGPVHALYNGVDLHTFAPNPSVPREDALILGVGRLVEKKGFTVLLQACRILRDQGHPLRCEIVGDGELRPKLEAEIVRLGLREAVQLLGVRPQEEIPYYLRRATLLAMPAVVARDGNRDALPTVLLEALACGTPVVASRLTGIPEIVDDGGNGLLVEPADAADLARAIGALLTDPELRARFGAAGRAKAERCFDLPRNVGELSRLFSHTADAPGPSACDSRSRRSASPGGSLPRAVGGVDQTCTLPPETNRNGLFELRGLERVMDNLLDVARGAQ